MEHWTGARVKRISRASRAIYYVARKGAFALPNCFVDEIGNFDYLLQFLREDSLRSVAQCILGPIVDLNHKAVGAGRYGSSRHGEDEISPARSVAGICDHRKGRFFSQDRDRVEIQREPRLIFEPTTQRHDASLAEQDIAVLVGNYSFCKAQIFVNLGGKASLEKDGLSRACGRLDQILIEHIPCTDLQNVRVLCDVLDIDLAPNLGNGGHAQILAYSLKVF